MTLAARPGRLLLIAGTLLITGSVFAWMAAMSQTPAGQEMTFPFWIFLAGVGLFGRGLYQWHNAGGTRFPIVPIILTMACSFVVSFKADEWAGYAVNSVVTARPGPMRGPVGGRGWWRRWREGIIEGQSMSDAHRASFSSDPALRCQAARHYGIREIPLEAGENLERLARDSDPSVQRCAFDAFAMWLRSSDAETRRQTMVRLVLLGGPAAALLREASVNDPSRENRELAAAYVARLTGKPQ